MCVARVHAHAHTHTPALLLCPLGRREPSRSLPCAPKYSVPAQSKSEKVSPQVPGPSESASCGVSAAAGTGEASLIPGSASPWPGKPSLALPSHLSHYHPSSLPLQTPAPPALPPPASTLSQPTSIHSLQVEPHSPLPTPHLPAQSPSFLPGTRVFNHLRSGT